MSQATSPKASTTTNAATGVGESAYFDPDKSKLDAFDHGHCISAQLMNTPEATLVADLSRVVSNAIDRI